MDQQKERIHGIDDYITGFPEDKQKLLQEVRATIKAAAPNAEEKISYGMPAFALNGNLVYFSLAKNHIGFYPTASGIEAFQDELAEYEHSKGAVKFPLDKPLPVDLITKIVQYRVSQNLNKAAPKTGKKKA